MSRYPQTRRDHADALRMRLLSCLEEVDHWSGDFDQSDEFVAKMLDARIALQEALVCVAEAINLMPEEE